LATIRLSNLATWIRNLLEIGTGAVYAIGANVESENGVRETWLNHGVTVIAIENARGMGRVHRSRNEP
jgi:hypothetical protein